tara:strand:+ start:68 stop:970 length:903 start_codon:yes stop_codon:yes gene_type:complete
VLDLFSGIGGFSYALERLCSAGAFQTIAFCEQDKFCQAVLRKHWPNTPIYDDVRTIDTDRLGRVDIIVGGFPCQPWSQAGEQRGAEDDRDLWPEMARLVGELRPRWLVGENVRGFVNQPMGLERSLSDLEGIGYQAVPFIIGACSVDAPHRRDRVWIIAHADSQGEPDGSVDEVPRPRKLVADANGEGLQGHTNANRQRLGQSRRQQINDQSFSRRKKNVADTDSERRRLRYTQRQNAEDDGQSPRGQKHRGWDFEPPVGRVAHGVPNRVDRLKALGNAVVPQVVAQIGRAIMEADECNP